MSLQTYRSSIDLIDNEIVKLLEKRKLYAKKIGEIKQKQGLNIFFNIRETEILHRLKSNSKKLEYWEIELVYNGIFRISRSSQIHISKE